MHMMYGLMLMLLLISTLLTPQTNFKKSGKMDLSLYISARRRRSDKPMVGCLDTIHLATLSRECERHALSWL